MHAWEQIQQTVDFIEEHIGEEIHIKSLPKLRPCHHFTISGSSGVR